MLGKCAIDSWQCNQNKLLIVSTPEVQIEAVRKMLLWDTEKTEAWLSKRAPKQVKSFLCCSSFLLTFKVQNILFLPLAF